MIREVLIVLIISVVALNGMASDTIPIPIGYEITSELFGDLDGDDIDEYIVVYTEEEKVIDENDPWGEFLDENRILKIFRKTSNKWVLWIESSDAVMSNEEIYGSYGTSYQIKIERGCLVIYHYMGSRDNFSYTHRYRYQNESFRLIGATLIDHFYCSSTQKFDFNLVTGNAIYTSETVICEGLNDEQEVVKTAQNFNHKLDSLPRLESFQPGSNAVALPDSEEWVYY